jgi:ABC-type dipeptide/oligopeptide/nickel transport system ATPase component
MNIFEVRKTPIEYTDGQRKALEKVETFLNSADHFFLLAGYSGCGKTTIAENIAIYAKADMMAPTNAAVNRLREKITDARGEFTTIHKKLFTPGEKTGKFFEKPGLSLKHVYIIDECSMIDKYVLEIIMKQAKEKKCKVIFMGDSFQLEPVGENPEIFRWEDSYPEDFFPHNRYELTEVKRYDGPLLQLATELRVNKAPVMTAMDTTDMLIVPKFTSELMKDIRADNDYVVLTSTNHKRVKYNEKIRAARFKMDGVDLNYAVNDEKLVSVSNAGGYANGEIFKLNKATFEQEFEIIVNSGKKDEYGDWIFKKYRVLHYLVGFAMFPQHVLLIPDLIEPSLQSSQILKSLLPSGANNEKPAYTVLPKPHHLGTFVKTKKYFKNETKILNPNLVIATYGYAISCHKAQGQEWKNVYIDAEWLMPVWDSAKWFYTAITRAKSKVQVTENKYLKINY